MPGLKLLDAFHLPRWLCVAAQWVPVDGNATTKYVVATAIPIVNQVGGGSGDKSELGWVPMSVLGPKSMIKPNPCCASSTVLMPNTDSDSGSKRGRASSWTYLDASVRKWAPLWVEWMNAGLLGYRIWDPGDCDLVKYGYFGINGTIELSRVVLKDVSSYYVVK